MKKIHRSRLINLKSARNLRTLGGLTNRNGNQIKDNTLYRSAALHELTAKDAIKLNEFYGVTKVIDLRTYGETDKHPDCLPESITYMHLPVFPDQVPGISREVEPGRADNLTVDMLPNLRNLYRDMVTDPVAMHHFSIILREILHHRDGAVLWHCTAGKDRCGMISVFIEHMLGIDQRTIYEDYLLTNLDSKKEGSKYSFLIHVFKRDPQLARKVFFAYSAEKEYLQAALSKIDQEYGSMKNYVINGLGISLEEIQEFRRYILV